MKRFCVLLGGLLAVTALVAVLFSVLRPMQPAPPQVRVLWVTRFDYTTSQDVRSIVANVAEAGFTDVFFQIRGNGTVFYPSQLEPWAHELSGGKLPMLGNNPGWDPLQLAIDEARPRGLRVHAYMNVLPGWKGLEDPPAAVRQLWTEHPDWFMVDSTGSKMLPTSGWYSFINPVLPEVRKHLRGIVKELCQYELDGIHLDYIRYPHDYHLVARSHYPDVTEEELMRHADFSYDPASQAALFDKYGWDVSRGKISRFRCDSVTRVVRDLSYVMQMEKPDRCLLTASVMGNPVDGKNLAYQDSGMWARRGLVDWIVQMNYGTKSFNRYLATIEKAAGKKKFGTSVVVGIYCKNDIEDILEQVATVKASGCRGLAVFSYSFLFDGRHRITEKGRMLLPKLRP
ncbi:MAG: family 10 glycosylhydrolase [Verrucomicrobiota bacterium]|nr:family 10 glycosylhydrolase [Verrucomicrobiota bacterium]